LTHTDPNPRKPNGDPEADRSVDPPPNWLLHGWRDAVDDERLEATRRRTAMFLLPVGGAAAILEWALELSEKHVTGFDLIAYPAVAVYLFALTVLVWRGHPVARAIDRPALAGAAAFVAGKLLFLYIAILRGGVDAAHIHDEALELSVWLPVFYVALFIVLEAGKGLGAALATFAPAMGLLLLDAGWERNAPSHLVGIALANTTMIGLVYVLARFRDERRAAQAMAMRMAHLANTDHLTGIPNRRGLAAILGREIAAAIRYRRTLSVIMLDPDRFKLVNDTHGHAVGDRILRELTALVSRHVRSADHVGRWGGEEFLVVAPETRGEVAARLSERLRRRIAAYRFAGPGTLTASFGVAEMAAGDDPDDIVKRADEALYQAKANGRDRVVLHAPVSEGAPREGSESTRTPGF
jgi:diguanylate cyclase (GGDEF)-like protein